MKKLKFLKWTFLTIWIILAVVGIATAFIMLPDNVYRISRRTVDGYDVRDYEKDELTEILLEKNNWDLTLYSDGVEIKVDDAISPIINETIEKAYNMRKAFHFDIKLSSKEIDEIVDEAIAEAKKYEVAGGSNDNTFSYDESKDKFVFNESAQATELNEKALKKELTKALKDKDFDKKILIEYDSIEEDNDAVKYELLSTFTTDTTSNSNRNTNIQIACETINGTIVEPGDTFSYNETLGKRTTAKGYKTAGVYINGQHATGIGGGICQLSSTMYNAVFAANLQVDDRTGHTFEPSYVRPGCDATVSYSAPDFKFTNDSGYPIGISCHFANQTVTVEIYGVRTLDEGVSRYMTSEKVSSIASGYVYENNESLLYNQEVITKQAKSGSKWATYEVLEKDSEIISKELIYYTSYKGESGVAQRNLTLDAIMAAEAAQNVAKETTQ